MPSGVRLFFLSFLLLFTELALIRWVPANVRLVGFFSNLILIGSFFGMGVGFLLARLRARLLFFFPVTLLCIVIFTLYYRTDINIASPDIIFFQPVFDTAIKTDPPEIILPIVFFLTALVFVPIAQEAGKIFRTLRPLTSYTLDILGSISGIVLFTVLSAMSTPSYIWFITIAALGTLLIFEWKNSLSGLSIVLMLAVPFTSYYYFPKDTIWSPYYKIALTKSSTGPPANQIIYEVNVNNLGHQYISRWQIREEFYFSPYKLFDSSAYKKILVVGAGTGADVATALALAPNVEHIDAVEIDPELIELGRELNPDKPYDDPRVTVIVNDGRRNFLQNIDKKYDLILYALTDSLTLTAHTSNIRLESFLFTNESFADARDHLAPGGLFVLYNYYREDWLIDTIATMLTDTFGKPPYVKSYGIEGKAAVFFAGPKTSEVPKTVAPYRIKERLKAPTDDWPFLYLKNPGIPAFYVRLIAVTLALASVVVAFILRNQKQGKFNINFFFLGAGFMLLETKSLVKFALLFGNTWIVNSLVFIAILISILLANLISFKRTIRHLRIFFVLLFACLVLNFVIPPEAFLGMNTWLRYIIASALYFSPVFFANLIFSQMFKNDPAPDTSFGLNLLGAVFGGFVEYVSLIIGYRMLLIVVGIFYALALGVHHEKVTKVLA